VKVGHLHGSSTGRICKALVEFSADGQARKDALTGPDSGRLAGSNSFSQIVCERRLVPAVVLATALALFGSGKLVVHGADFVLDGDAGEQRRLVGAKGLHGSRLVIVDRTDRQIQDIGDLFDNAAQADQANNFQLPRSEGGYSLLHVTRHKVRFNPFTVAKNLARRSSDAARHGKINIRPLRRI
jgi:hypothetical protein